jgi:hypothetical protein
VNKGVPGILAWVIGGDHSAEKFKWMWKIIRGWKCFFYVTDGVTTQVVGQETQGLPERRA